MLFFLGLGTAECPRLVTIFGGAGNCLVESALRHIVFVFVDDLALERPDGFTAVRELVVFVDDLVRPRYFILGRRDLKPVAE